MVTPMDLEASFYHSAPSLFEVFTTPVSFLVFSLIGLFCCHFSGKVLAGFKLLMVCAAITE